MLRNLRKQKIVEEELNKGEDLYRRVVEDQTELICRSSSKGHIIYVNQAYCDYFGKSREELLGCCFLPDMPQDDGERLKQHLCSIDLKKPVGVIEHRVVNNGEIKWLQWTTRAMFNAHGDFCEFQSVGRDITERMKVQLESKNAYEEMEQMAETRTAELMTASRQLEGQAKNIRESQTMFQSIFNGISDPLIVVDKELSLKMLNKAALKYYKVELPDVIGTPCYQQFKGRKEPCIECAIPEVLSEGRSITIEQRGFMDPEIMEQIVIYPIKENDSEASSAIIRVTDITKAKQMEKHLMQSEKLAALGILISGIAHEINNPNNFISFNIPILRDYLIEIIPIIDNYAEGRQDFKIYGMSYDQFREDLFLILDNIEHGSNRIDATVSILREFSRRKDDVKPDWVDIRKVIEKSVDISQGKIKRMVKSFTVVMPENLPLIHTDPNILEQVLINILINAAQAADKNESWIRLNVALGHTWEEHLIIEIIDNGCGMDDKTISRVFAPFFTTKPPGEGTGMGLYLSHLMVEGLGGRIELESQPGKGSTFRIILNDKDQRKIKRL